MAMGKIPVKRLLYIALVYAEQNMESMIESLTDESSDEERAEMAEVEAIMEQVRKYRLRRFGECKFDQLRRVKQVSIFDVMRGGKIEVSDGRE